MSICRGRDLRPETVPLPPVHLAILSDDRLFYEGLRRIVAAHATFRVVGNEDGTALRESDPNLLLLDSRMKQALGVCAALTRELGVSVVFVAAPEDDSWALKALDVGARGILPISAGSEDMILAIRTVADGLIWARRRVISMRIDQLAGKAPTLRMENIVLEQRLSLREREVFRYAATGLGNKELADRLAISEATVKVHLTHIFQKLGLSGRAELAALYHGIITSPRSDLPGIEPRKNPGLIFTSV